MKTKLMDPIENEQGYLAGLGFGFYTQGTWPFRQQIAKDLRNRDSDHKFSEFARGFMNMHLYRTSDTYPQYLDQPNTVQQFSKLISRIYVLRPCRITCPITIWSDDAFPYASCPLCKGTGELIISGIAPSWDLKA